MAGIKYLDIFGEKVKIYINRKESIQSTLGGILTIIMFSLLATATWLIGKDIFFKKSPFSYQESLKRTNYPSLNITRQSFPFGIQATDFNSVILNDETYINMKVNYREYRVDDKGVYYLAKETELQLERCQYHHFPVLTKEEYNNASLDQYSCLKDESINLFGYWSESSMNYLEIALNMCNPLDRSDCKSDEEIAQYIRDTRLNLNIIYLNPFLENTNFKDPIRYSITLKYIYALSTASKAASFGVETNSLLTDDGLIFEDFQPKDFFRIIELTPPDPLDINAEIKNLITFEIYSSNTYTLYYRKYFKVPEILASIGGLLNVCVVVFSLINLAFSRLNRNVLAINKLFDVYNLTNNTGEAKNHITNNPKSPGIRMQNIEVQIYKKNEFSVSSNSLRKNISGVSATPDFTTAFLYQTKAQKIRKTFRNRTQFKLSGCEKIKILLLRRCKSLYSDELLVKEKLYDKGVLFLMTYFDLINIIKKLEEFDLLKKIILSERQLKLFNIFSKLGTNENIGIEKLGDLEVELKDLAESREKSIIDKNLMNYLD
jgi:hypothetical protein